MWSFDQTNDPGRSGGGFVQTLLDVAENTRRKVYNNVFFFFFQMNNIMISSKS
jgi:hypothetical protein